MRRAILILTFACMLGSAQPPQATHSSTATPQADAKSGEQDSTRIRTNVDIVNVVFTVQDDAGRFVQDLTQNQFRVLDNKKPPKEITSFSSQTGLPLRVGLVIDASNSVRDRFKFEQQAATEFLQQTLAPDSDQAMVESFDEIYEVVQDFTNDLDKLSASIRKIRPGGSTAMWDAVYYACREKLLKLQSDAPARNVIVLISDGNDTQSHVFPQEAIEMAQHADVSIYTVSTSLGFGRTEGDNNLKVLAESTGGEAFFPLKLDDVAAAFVRIQHELRSQYSISYKPDNFLPDGKFHFISIKPIPSGLKVRSKKGYFARKQQGN